MMNKWKPYPDWLSFTQVWPGRGEGRYMKRRLSKARRKYAKQMIKHGRGKEPVTLESEVNWKGW